MPNPKAVRNIDQSLWQRLRAYAVRIGLPVGEVLNEAIKDFLARVKA